MGTDIHTCLQVKKGAKWETIATDIYDGRNYALFSVLAGVRGQEEPIAEPRGYPKGFLVDDENMIPVNDENMIPVDEVLFFEPYWMGDFGHSWLTLAEIRDRVDEDRYSREAFGYFSALEYIKAKMVIAAYDNCLKWEDVRLVFGFDS